MASYVSPQCATHPSPDDSEDDGYCAHDCEYCGCDAEEEDCEQCGAGPSPDNAWVADSEERGSFRVLCSNCAAIDRSEYDDEPDSPPWDDDDVDFDNLEECCDTEEP